jgi:hypothetical protein
VSRACTNCYCLLYSQKHDISRDLTTRTPAGFIPCGSKCQHPDTAVQDAAARQRSDTQYKTSFICPCHSLLVSPFFRFYRSLLSVFISLYLSFVLICFYLYLSLLHFCSTSILQLTVSRTRKSNIPITTLYCTFCARN